MKTECGNPKTFLYTLFAVGNKFRRVFGQFSKSKMKIIQLLQMPQLRGAELFACQLSNHLVKHGHEVLVVCIFKGDANLPFTGEIIFLNRSINSRFFDYLGWKKFHRIVEGFDPDIIQANAADTLKFAASSKMLFGFNAPVVLRNANKAGDFMDSNIKKWLNQLYLKQISYVISVSNECKKDFINTFDFPKNRISTVKIGVENKDVEGIPSDLIEVFENNIVISHIGSFVPEKNHEGLLRQFAIIQKAQPSAQLLLIGKGNLEQEIKNSVQKSEFRNKVHFLGYREDVLEILKNSDVFVLPSLIEGFPGVILEAMYCKTPVVAYNVGGISEIVNPETGALIEKNDEEAFSNAVLKAIQEPDRDQIEKAHDLIMKNFLNEKISLKFLEKYQLVGAN